MNYQNIINEIKSEIEPFYNEGQIANYIPALAKIDPKQFAMSIKLIDGSSYNVGNTQTKFSIQSISKVFTFTLALQLYGKELYKRVGHEPSGDPFNSLVQLEYENGIPRNPFINAGAIVTTDSLLSKYQDKSFDYILDFIQKASEAGIQGIGTYFPSTSGANFVHLDIGGVRQWGPTGSRRSQYGWAKSTFKSLGYAL